MSACAYIRACVILLSVVLLTACNEGFDYTEHLPAEPTTGEVVIRASQPFLSRTAMGEVGNGSVGSAQTIRWSDGDRILVWAEHAASGNYAIDGVPFTLATYNAEYTSADFMATVGEMAEATYHYTALYPLPTTQNGTTVSYTIPSAQSGAYDPTLDVMTATTTGNALSPSDGFHTDVEWKQPTLAFNHLFHLIRIRIPEGKNNLGLPIKRLEITFPQEVVGTVSFDALDPVNTQSWSNLSNKITVELSDDQLIDAGKGYVWLHIKPTEINGAVTFCAYDDAGVKSYDLTTTIQRTMAAQRITPIALTIPGPHIPIVYLDLREQANHLGEAWQKITLSGLTFGDGTPNGTTNTVTINATDEDYVVAVYPTLNSDGTANMSSVRGVAVTTTFESEHALLTNKTITLPSSLQPTTEYTSPINDTPFTVPYLLYEDFNAAPNNTSQTDTESGSTLDAVGLTGWSGSRWATESGTLRLSTYVGTSAAGGTDINYGRSDSPQLSGLKAGVTVNVRISFDLGLTRISGNGLWGLGAWDIQASAHFGTSPYDSANPTPSGGETGVAGSGSANYPTNRVANITDCTMGDGLTVSSMKNYAYTLSGNSATRFTWLDHYLVHKGAPATKKVYVYIDNIKVQIAN